MIIRTNLLTAGAFLLFFAMSTNFIEAVKLDECTTARELVRGGISKTFISNWVCLMKSESNLDTQLITGPKTGSSYNFGIFQISSLKWCIRGRPGGICNKKCEDFANNDIQDDIVCAKKIQELEGFKAWNGWTSKCKGKPLPDVSQCKRRRRRNSIA